MSNLEGKKILAIDDDPLTVEILKRTFLQEKAEVYTARSGSEGLREFYSHQPDLVILDIMMPEMDGWEVSRQIRQLSDVPVILLTALDQHDQMIRGLEQGADDYVLKPFRTTVLLARVQAMLRRLQTNTAQRSDLYYDDYLSVDLTRNEVLVRGQAVALTTKEYRLLCYLINNRDRLLTYQHILEHVWGWGYQDSVDYVHVYVSRLRRKLEVKPKRPKYLLTEHGSGYWFSSHDTS